MGRHDEDAETPAVSPIVEEQPAEAAKPHLVCPPQQPAILERPRRVSRYCADERADFDAPRGPLLDSIDLPKVGRGQDVDRRLTGVLQFRDNWKQMCNAKADMRPLRSGFLAKRPEPMCDAE